jgi:ABC-2 type transport system permease protein
MRKILAVVKREYLQIVRTKGFIIGTVLGPVFMSLMLIVPIVFSVMTVEQQETVAVVDASGEVFPGLERKLDEVRLKDGSLRYILEEYRISDDPQGVRELLNQKVLKKELSAYLFLPEDIVSGGGAEFVSEHVSDFEKTQNIRSALNSVIIEKRLKGAEIDPQLVGRLMMPVSLSTHKVTTRGVEEDTGGTFLVSYFLVLILYMTLIFYGQAIMRGVIEEKSSRVVEIVLSSLKPFQLMAGKIVGIAAVGFTQYAIWTLFGIALATRGRALASSAFPQMDAFKIPTIPPYVFIYFVIYFVLGYFLYSTLFAAVGSMVNNEKEAQQLIMPVIMMLVIPLLLIMFVMRSPNSTLSVTLSLIPFFAPMLMLLRITILLPSFIQILGSIALMIAAILAMIWLSAKIYRVGILMYGKPPRLPEIVKWLRYR